MFDAPHLTSTFFFSATSFYPGHEAFTNTVLFHHPSCVNSTNEHLADVNDGDTEVESETDWLSELPPADPAGRKKTTEVMLVEVSISFFFNHQNLPVFYSIQSGRTLLS